MTRSIPEEFHETHPAFELGQKFRALDVKLAFEKPFRTKAANRWEKVFETVLHLPKNQQHSFENFFDTHVHKRRLGESFTYEIRKHPSIPGRVMATITASGEAKEDMVQMLMGLAERRKAQSANRLDEFKF